MKVFLLGATKLGVPRSQIGDARVPETTKSDPYGSPIPLVRMPPHDKSALISRVDLEAPSRCCFSGGSVDRYKLDDASPKYPPPLPKKQLRA